MLKPPRAPGEPWCDWNTRTLRKARGLLHRHEVSRWSTVILAQVWGLHGHAARGDEVAKAMLSWRNLHWWRVEQTIHPRMGGTEACQKIQSAPRRREATRGRCGGTVATPRCRSHSLGGHGGEIRGEVRRPMGKRGTSIHYKFGTEQTRGRRSAPPEKTAKQESSLKRTPPCRRRLFAARGTALCPSTFSFTVRHLQSEAPQPLTTDTAGLSKTVSMLQSLPSDAIRILYMSHIPDYAMLQFCQLLTFFRMHEP